LQFIDNNNTHKFENLPEWMRNDESEPKTSD
jgi:hypothetical protein